MKLSPILVLSLLVACGGEQAPPTEALTVVVEDAGPPEPPEFGTSPGTYQVAWTTELTDVNRPGPPIAAGTSVEVVAVNGDQASVRTPEDPPRAGKMPVHRLISGTRMQPGITAGTALLSERLDGTGGVSIDVLTLVVPYLARSGKRAVVNADGQPRWIAGDALRHDPDELALGAKVAEVRWAHANGDVEGVVRRLRSLETTADGNDLIGVARELFAPQIGEAEPFELLDDRVHDPESGLSWRRCADGQGWSSIRRGCEGAGTLMERDRAAAACGSFRSDDGAWRLPSTEELETIRQCWTGAGTEGPCLAPQSTATLVDAFQVPADRVWTRDRDEDSFNVVDLSTGMPANIGTDEEALALCVTEAFDGNTYLQTINETPTTRLGQVEEGEVPVLLDASMLYLTAMPAHVPEDELDDLVIQLRTPQGVRWTHRNLLKQAAFPLQAIAVEAVLLPEDALKTGNCVELFGPSDRITSGEDVRVVGPAEQVGTLIVEVERGCKGDNGLTFRNVSTVALNGPSLRVRSDAEDPCRDISARVPPRLRENMSGRLPNHPVLCSEWHFEESEELFPGATTQFKAYLEHDVVVEASAFTGYIIDGQLISGTPVAVDAKFEGGRYNLIASTRSDALRRTSDIVIHQATLFEWTEVTAKLQTGGGSREEMFTFDPASGNLTGSLGLQCTFDSETVAYQCE